jgi:tetratricopeptide (TPR) repeat protein
LAGVLGASGVEVTADQLSPQIYLPERKGSVQVELLAASRRAGRIPYILDPEPAALVRELESGRPVLVFQNLRTPQFPVWHYAVLTGFDPRANLFFLNTGEHQAREEDAGSFLRTWDWAGRWAVVVLQPGELPQDPDRLRYLQAIADFEGVAGPDAAEPAWRKAVAQWPQDHRPYLALGNAAYKSGDYAEAVSQFLNGLELKPDDAALENNLASALAQAGCPRVALARLKDLLEDLDRESPWYVDLSNTLNELSGSLGADSTDCPDYLKP